MKNIKLGIIAGIVLFVAVFISIQSVNARTNRGDNVVAQIEAVDNYSVNMVLPAISTATSTGLVDISDVTNFPHYINSGSIEISRMAFELTSNDIATSTYQIGVIASTTIAGDLVDVFWFEQFQLSASYSTENEKRNIVFDYSPSVVKTRISGGVPTKFLTNNKDLLNGEFATSTAITSPRGSYTMSPNVGDIVMRIYDRQGTGTTTASLHYKVIQ